MEPLIIKGHIYSSILEALTIMTNQYMLDEVRHDIRDYFEAFLELCYYLEENPQIHFTIGGPVYE